MDGNYYYYCKRVPNKFYFIYLEKKFIFLLGI